MEEQELGAALSALASGGSFTRFAAVTRGHWSRMAAHLMRRFVGSWRLPPGIEEEDVAQEMLLAAWGAVRRYDASRGESLAGFVVFTATNKAEKWLHKVRGAGLHGTPGTRPSWFPIGESRLTPAWAEETSPVLEMLGGSVPATQEADYAGRRLAALIEESCATTGERAVVRALAANDGDVEMAASSLYADPVMRVAHWLTTEQSARRFARAQVRLVRDRLAAK